MTNNGLTLLYSVLRIETATHLLVALMAVTTCANLVTAAVLFWFYRQAKAEAVVPEVEEKG